VDTAAVTLDFRVDHRHVAQVNGVPSRVPGNETMINI
jgi:hypothetical protein